MTIVRSGRGKAQWLTSEVKGGKLVISVGLDVLAFAAQRHYDEAAFNASEGRNAASEYCIADAETFAKEVIRVLEREAEDGTNRIHVMLDEAFDEAMNQGADGLAERELPDDAGERSP